MADDNLDIDELQTAQSTQPDEDPYHVYLLRRPHERASSVVPQLPKQPEMAETRLRYRRIPPITRSGSFSSLGGHFPARFQMPNRQSLLDSLTSDDETNSFAVVSRRSFTQFTLHSKSSSPKLNPKHFLNKQTKKKKRRKIRRSSVSTNNTNHVFSDDEIIRKSSYQFTPAIAPPTIVRPPQVPFVSYDDSQFLSSIPQYSDDSDSSTPLSTSPTTAPLSDSTSTNNTNITDDINHSQSKLFSNTPRRQRASFKRHTSDIETQTKSSYSNSGHLNSITKQDQSTKKTNSRKRHSKKNNTKDNNLILSRQNLSSNQLQTNIKQDDDGIVRKLHSYHVDTNFGMTVSHDGRPISAPLAMHPQLRQNFVLRPEIPVSLENQTSTRSTDRKRDKQNNSSNLNNKLDSEYEHDRNRSNNRQQSNSSRSDTKVRGANKKLHHQQQQQQQQTQSKFAHLDLNERLERDRELSLSFAHTRFSAEEAATKPLNAIQKLWHALAFARSGSAKLTSRRHT